MGKYALLLSGGIDKKYNYPRYKNDLEWVYKVLVEDCNYEQKDIKIFYADGKPLNYAGNCIITSKADKDELVQYLEDMALLLTEKDVFTMVVSNHGGDTATGGCIYLWGIVPLELNSLVALLRQIKAQKYIILGECYGGNILNWDIENSCIVTANERGCVSYTNPQKPDYDELIRHLFSYIHKGYPDGISIPQGSNDVKDAYRFACVHDALKPGSLLAQQYGISEMPQMECNMSGRIQF